METRKRILVLGAGGMLGHKLAQVLAADGRLAVACTTRRPVDPAFSAAEARYLTNVDVLAGASALRAVLEKEQPDVIVNALGAVKQRDLMSAMDATFYVNGTLPHLLAQLNPNPAGRVLSFSTDCVFVGDRGQYTEQDQPDALDLYGRSKACGEIGYGPHLTLRTSIVGFEIATHLSLLSWLFRQPRGASIRGFTNAIFSGLPTVVLAQSARDLLVRDTPLSGLYHIASEPIRKHDLLVRLNAAFGLELEIIPDPDFVIDRSLDDTRFRTTTGTVRPGWDALIDALVQDYRQFPYHQFYRSLAGTISSSSSSQ